MPYRKQKGKKPPQKSPKKPALPEKESGQNKQQGKRLVTKRHRVVPRVRF